MAGAKVRFELKRASRALESALNDASRKVGAGVSVSVEHDFARLGEWLDGYAARAGDLSRVMNIIAGQMLESTQERFLRERAPGGRAWERLAASTMKRNPRRLRPATLRDANRLFMSLTTAHDESSAEVGTNTPYAAIHQFGGTLSRAAGRRTAWFRLAQKGAGVSANGLRVGSKLRFARASDRAKSLHSRTFDVGAHTIRVPARPFLGFDAEDERKILGALEAQLAGGDAPAGGRRR